MLFVMTSYKRTVLSQEETSKNCEEFGPNLTDDIPSSGGVLSLNSVLDSVIPEQTSTLVVINPCTEIKYITHPHETLLQN